MDGSGCAGTQIELQPYALNVSTWNATSKVAQPAGEITSYAILGGKDTWQMYLHGPNIQAVERASVDDIPPIYVYATFTNQVYRFENFDRFPSVGQKPTPLKATQKMVGHAYAPSTGWVVRDAQNKIGGIMVAEGQPFGFDMHMPSRELSLGGVEYVRNGHTKNCSTVFPLEGVHKHTGQVVNTIDCHKGTGVCFFTVWVFYDDEGVMWNMSQKVSDDCLYYCMMEDTLSGEPRCRKTAVVVDENNSPVCHKKGVGAVHGMTVGNTDAEDPTKFDIFLVFTGKAEMSNGESSMKKLQVQVVESAGGHDLKTLHSKPFAVDLFTKYAATGLDVGGDHAWVDETGKYVWISCFRVGGLGAHMVDYEDGALIHSITGLGTYAAGQYTYTAGIHGVGTLGKPGSLLAIATSSCKDIRVCIPTVPWHWPIPEKDWTTAPFIIIDLASLAKKQLGRNTDDTQVLV